MKQLYTIFLILVLSSSLALSQNSCNYKFSVPDELTRGRYQEPDMREGHPYLYLIKTLQVGLWKGLWRRLEAR